MSEQNNAAPLTGDEIRTAVAFARSISGPSDATQPGEYVLAGALALLSKPRAPVADERTAFKKCHSVIIKALSSIARADGPDTRKADDPELLYRSPVMDDVVRIRVALDECSAALASAPVADETYTDEHGTTWARPTAEAYAEVCKALNKARASTPRVDALMAQWDDDGATRGPAFIALRDLARSIERQRDEIVSATAAAKESLFSQCCSNPIKNAWGEPVDLTALNRLFALASAPVADERVNDDTLWSWAEQIMGGKEAHHVGRDRVLRFARAALASTPVAGEADQPAEYQRRCRPIWENARVGWTEWERCTAEQAAECEKAPLVHDWQYEVRRLYAAPRASAPVAGDAQDIQRAIAEAIGFGFEPGETQTVNAQDLLFLAEVLRRPNVAPQASKAVQEFIDATDAFLASTERKTWTPGFAREMPADERILAATRFRDARAALVAQLPQEDES